MYSTRSFGSQLSSFSLLAAVRRGEIVYISIKGVRPQPSPSTMARSLLLCAAQLLLLSPMRNPGVAGTTTSIDTVGSTGTPPPPRQTEVQMQRTAAVAREAAHASEAATPQLLALLRSSAFTSALGSCCPELDGLSAPQLLAAYQGQLAVTEVAHGFFAVNSAGAAAPNNAADVNLTQAASATWFYNEWQLQVLFPDYIDFWEVIGGSCSLGPAAAAEVGPVFQLPRFSAEIPHVPGAFPGGWPASLAEASDRVVYTLFNQRRTALPCAPWGDVNVVFAPALAQQAVRAHGRRPPPHPGFALAAQTLWLTLCAHAVHTPGAALALRHRRLRGALQRQLPRADEPGDVARLRAPDDTGRVRGAARGVLLEWHGLHRWRGRRWPR
jgi:hypothetical protein